MELLKLLYDKTTETSQVLIFVNSQQDTVDLKEVIKKQPALKELHIECVAGNVEPETRNALVRDFRTGKTNIMIATNVMARGIDIRKVCLVINLYPPRKFAKSDKAPIDIVTYIHRIARTGRFDDRGVALTIYSGC